MAASLIIPKLDFEALINTDKTEDSNYDENNMEKENTASKLPKDNK